MNRPNLRVVVRVTLSGAAANRLIGLRSRLDATSNAEVVRAALRLLQAEIGRQEANKRQLANLLYFPESVVED